MRKVGAISVRWPYGKASNLDSNTGVLKLWEVEDNSVIKTRADAQDSGRRDECTLIELSGQPKATTITKSRQRAGVFNARRGSWFPWVRTWVEKDRKNG